MHLEIRSWHAIALSLALTGCARFTSLTGSPMSGSTSFQIQSISAAAGQVQTCPALQGFVNQPDLDASATLENCIRSTPAGGILSIPAGVYGIVAGIAIDRPILFATEGLDQNSPSCSKLPDGSCVHLLALPSAGAGTLVQVLSDGAGIDHVIIDGNRPNRSTLGSNNLTYKCSNCSLTNSEIIHSVVANGGAFFPGRGLLISNNFIAYNGKHNVYMGWADGLTVFQADDSIISGNTFIDNTDIDLIIGGGRNLKVTGNYIVHSADFAGSSYVALNLSGWPPGTPLPTSGDFTGADVSFNAIDCGGANNCGFGLQIGGDPYYNAMAFGGSVHDNTITNAELGFDIEHTSGVVHVYNNVVNSIIFNPAGYLSSCGVEATSSYNVSADSVVDFSGDTVPPAAYTHVKHCILNWWTDGGRAAPPQSVSAPSAPIAQVCYPGSLQMCSIANGAGYQACAANGQSWGSCQLASCNSGFVQSGNMCVSSSSPAAASSVPANFSSFAQSLSSTYLGYAMAASDVSLYYSVYQASGCVQVVKQFTTINVGSALWNLPYVQYVSGIGQSNNSYNYGFMTVAYQTIFGIAPADASINYWVGLLNSGSLGNGSAAALALVNDFLADAATIGAHCSANGLNP